MTKETMKTLKEQFLFFLSNNDFDSAESLLAEDIFLAEDLMDEISEEDYKGLEKHWSAVQSGEQIITPLEMLKEISEHMNFKDGESLIDIGSGHGHPAFVFGALNPSLKVTGYEIVKEKVTGALKTKKKLELKNINFIEQDLSDKSFSLPLADYYYLYNPMTDVYLKEIVKEISELSKIRDITAISADGKDVGYFIEEGFKEVSTLYESGVHIFKKTFIRS